MPHASIAGSSELPPTTGGTRPVLFVESYPQVIAGQQRTLMSLLEAWSEHYDIPAAVLVPREGVYVEELQRRGVDVRHVPQPERLGRYGGAIYHDGLLAKIKTRWQAVGYIRGLRRMLRERDVQAVFCNDMRGILTAGIAARSLGLPVMTWDKLDKPHGVLLDALQLPLVQRNVMISQAIQKKYPRWQRRLYARRMEVVPDGVNLDVIDAGAPIRQELGFTDDDIVIALVGTITERKGQDRLLAILPDLLERVPDALIVFVGETGGNDEDERYLKSLPNRDHPRVRFLGFRHDVPPIMHSIDVLVAPSRHEGLGLVIAEAMACGVPVAGANAGGIPEIVAEGETGIIFNGDDPQAVLGALVRLCEDSELRLRMGRAGRERAEKYFNRPRQMRRVCDLFHNLLQ